MLFKVAVLPSEGCIFCVGVMLPEHQELIILFGHNAHHTFDIQQKSTYCAQLDDLMCQN